MKLIDVEVEWYKGWANEPILRLFVDELPKRDEYVFDEKDMMGHTLYFAEHECGTVSFMSHASNNERGYGGSVFKLKMKDGTTREVKGPWSSRAGAMNLYFPHCVDVIIHQQDGACGIASAISLSLARKAAKVAGVQLVQKEWHDDIVYRIET